MFGIGAPEFVLILIIALIFIGPSKLPDLARTVGRGYRELQNTLSGVKNEFSEETKSFHREIISPPEESEVSCPPVPAAEPTKGGLPTNRDEVPPVTGKTT